jgi:hypothetical protein
MIDHRMNDIQLPGDPTVSADTTFWEAPWTTNKPAQWTLGTNLSVSVRLFVMTDVRETATCCVCIIHLRITVHQSTHFTGNYSGKAQTNSVIPYCWSSSRRNANITRPRAEWENYAVSCTIYICTLYESSNFPQRGGSPLLYQFGTTA